MSTNSVHSTISKALKRNFSPSSVTMSTITQLDVSSGSQPPSSNQDENQSANPAPCPSSFQEPTSTPSTLSTDDSPTSAPSIFMEDIFNPLTTADDFGYDESRSASFFPFGNPMDAIDVDEAAFRQFCEEFQGLEQWRREYSYAEFFERQKEQPEDPSPSVETSLEQPAVLEGPVEVTLEMVNSLDGVTKQVNRLLNAACEAPKPPKPEPSIFRDRQPYDTFGYPQECFYIKPPSKDKKAL